MILRKISANIFPSKDGITVRKDAFDRLMSVYKRVLVKYVSVTCICTTVVLRDSVCHRYSTLQLRALVSCGVGDVLVCVFRSSYNTFDRDLLLETVIGGLPWNYMHRCLVTWPRSLPCVYFTVYITYGHLISTSFSRRAVYAGVYWKSNYSTMMCNYTHGEYEEKEIPLRVCLHLWHGTRL
jgi:hypothetical protein